MRPRDAGHVPTAKETGHDERNRLSSPRRRCARSRPRWSGSRSTTSCSRRGHLFNLAARKAGLGVAAGRGGPTRDLEQVRQAIDGARALLPLLEPRHREQLGPVRDTLSQLQMIYAQSGPAAGRRARRRGGPPPKPGGAGPAQPLRAPLGPGAVLGAPPAAARWTPRAPRRPPAGPRSVDSRPFGGGPPAASSRLRLQRSFPCPTS